MTKIGQNHARCMAAFKRRSSVFTYLLDFDEAFWCKPYLSLEERVGHMGAAKSWADKYFHLFPHLLPFRANRPYLWWRFGVVVNALVSINEVTLPRAPLVLGWVTLSGGSTPGAGKSISVYSHPPRSTQPGHPCVGRRNEYQSKGSDMLRLGSKGRYGSWVGGR